MVRCYLYKKQIEVCSKDTRVSRRADTSAPLHWSAFATTVAPRTRSKDTLAKCGPNSAARVALPEAKPVNKSTRQVSLFDRGERKRKMKRAFDVDLRDFPMLQASPPGLSSSDWLQHFTIGRGFMLSVTAKWVSKEKSEESYRAQAGPSTQASGDITTSKESEELKKVRNEIVILRSKLAEVRKDAAMIKTAVSAAKPDGERNGADGWKRRAVGDVSKVDSTECPNQIKQPLKQIYSTLQEITKKIVIVKAQNRFIDSRLRDLARRTGLPESPVLLTELSQLISGPNIVAEFLEKQISCPESDPKAEPSA
ncbi:hypothetical protein MRX96_047864 [Rhipicephalus microplus]